MRSFVCILFISLFISSHANENEHYRDMIDAAAGNAGSAYAFHKTMKSTSLTSPLMNGYRAMSELMLCNYVLSPVSKLAHFNKGKNMLEEAIKSAPDNAELRFYRYCTQLNAPRILNYSQNLLEDRLILLRFLEAESKNKKKDLDLYTRIKTFLFTSEFTPAAEKEQLKKL